jgi:sugar (pentulose or hexulose) kinase
MCSRLDIGTSSVRAHAFDETAEEQGEPARRDYAGGYDSDHVVARTREAIDEAARERRRRPYEVVTSEPTS